MTGKKCFEKIKEKGERNIYRKENDSIKESISNL